MKLGKFGRFGRRKMTTQVIALPPEIRLAQKQASAERAKSQSSLEHARKTVIEPLREMRQENHVREIITNLLSEGKDQRGTSPG